MAGALLAMTVLAAPAGASASGGHRATRTVAEAYARTLNAKTASFRLVERAARTFTVQRSSGLEIDGGGVVDMRRWRANAHVDIARARRHTSAGSARGAHGASPATIVERGATDYVQLGGTAAKKDRAYTKGKRWIAVKGNVASVTEAGRHLPPVASAATAMPPLVLATIAAHPDSARRVGTAVLAGTKTTEYRAYVSLRSDARRLGDTHHRKEAQEVRLDAKMLGVETESVHVWIGPHGRIRQIRVEVPIAAQTFGGVHGAGDRAIATVTFTKFGVGPPGRVGRRDVTDATPMILRHAKHVAQ